MNSRGAKIVLIILKFALRFPRSNQRGFFRLLLPFPLARYSSRKMWRAGPQLRSPASDWPAPAAVASCSGRRAGALFI